MNILRIAAIVILITQNAAAQRPVSASIEGIVLKTGSNDVVPKASLELRAQLQQSQTQQALLTASDSDGRFVFRDVPPGRYRLVATRTGYATAEYGQRGATSGGLPITVNPGQAISGLQIAMTPTGAISGIITDNLGKPLANATVQAVKASYQNGQRVLTVMKSVRTDDLGGYRLFWLTPGSYFVNVIVPGNRDYQSSGLVANPTSTGGGGRSFLVWDDPLILTRPFDSLVDESEAYVPIYFPGTADMAAASIVEVRPEADTPGVNIRALTVRTARLRGVVTDASTAQPVGSVQIGLLSANPSVPNTYAVASDANTGAFSFTKVIPGSYVLVARTNTGLFGSASVDLRERDAKDVSIALVPAFNISGAVRVENPPAGLNITSIGIGLMRYPLVQGQALLTITIPGGGTTRQGITAPSANVRNISADGSFTIANVPPGDYRVFVNPIMLPQAPPGSQPPTVPQSLQNTYVKSIRLGGAEVLDGVLHVDRQPESPLEIVLAANPSAVEGRIMNGAGQAAPGSTVVLLPDTSRRFRTELYKTSVADEAGRFQIQGIPPGNYTVFAWEDVEAEAWQDPDFMSRIEDRGKPIHVLEGSKTAIDVTTIGPKP